MTQSHFKNPHGLTEEGQFSTALDLAILAREVTKTPYFRECMKTKAYVFQYPDGRTRTLTNTNKILSRLTYCTGMKTGTTRASGRCLVCSGVLNGKAVIAVALSSSSAEIWNDSEKLLKWALE
jgi:D-alanyl-D-alanine carboxypeptidase (penicillin-binding protein 5/6)